MQTWGGGFVLYLDFKIILQLIFYKKYYVMHLFKVPTQTEKV